MLTSESVPDGHRNSELSSTETQDFARFARLLQEGNNDAADRLTQRYAVRLRNIAARRIGAELRPKFDPDDVVQSVLGSFFANLRDGKVDIDTSRNLSGLLAIMVARKCARYANRYSAANRDCRREQSTSQSDRDGKTQELFIDRQPLPDESVLLTELLDRWISTFDAVDRQIIELLLQGHTTAEVTLQVQCSQRTVQRTVRRFIQRSGLTT